MNREITRNAILGIACGDALGCPVQFYTREEVRSDPVRTMRGYGTFNLPPGSWTDDTSLTLAALASIQKLGRIDQKDIMDQFCSWLYEGEYTPFGYAYDIGFSTRRAIERFHKGFDVTCCGCHGERDNGNGSLMRIMPACLYAYERKCSDEEAIAYVDQVSSLTHSHPRAKTACGLYYFMVTAILEGNGTLKQRLQAGLDHGFAFYSSSDSADQLTYYRRLESLDQSEKTEESEISSSGYVVDSLIAALWCLITENSLEASLLKAVNLGEDTDTIAAIAGGLAGIFYTEKAIPPQWLNCLQKKELIESLCE